jgi:hypothetical protein
MVRGVLVGAFIGALVGCIGGLVVHAILSSDASLIEYEALAGLFGIILGAGLGAFYGGALRVPRNRT